MYCKKRDKCYEKFFFKIDYYDLDFNYGADPLSEPFKRVLTIMKAEEYQELRYKMKKSEAKKVLMKSFFAGI